MKVPVRIAMVVFMALFLFSCSHDRTTIKSETPSGQSVSESKADFIEGGEWIERGAEGYGIVLLTWQDGSTDGRAIRCRVLSVRPGRVKMKSIETVAFNDAVGCDLNGVHYGMTWWETHGDVFKTKEEAEKHIRENYNTRQ